MKAEESVLIHKQLCKDAMIRVHVHEATGKILDIRCIHCRIRLYHWEDDMVKFFARENFFF